MEEAKTEQNALDFRIFFFDFLFREESESSFHVSFDT
jgi:hypothetical protein